MLIILSDIPAWADDDRTMLITLSGRDHGYTCMAPSRQ